MITLKFILFIIFGFFTRGYARPWDCVCSSNGCGPGIYNGGGLIGSGSYFGGYGGGLGFPISAPIIPSLPLPPVPRPAPIKTPCCPPPSVTIPNIILALLPPTPKPPVVKPCPPPPPPPPIVLPIPQPCPLPIPQPCPIQPPDCGCCCK